MDTVDSDAPTRAHPSEPDPPETPTGGPLLLTIDRVAELLSAERHTVDRLVADGTIPSVRVGRKRLVVAESLPAFVAGLLAEQAAR